MLSRRKFLATGASVPLAACSKGDEMSSGFYEGPPVTHIEVRKDARQMYLWSDGQVIRNYEVDLGFAPKGPKRVEGDGKTPEGQYWIDRRNRRSSFYLSLGISYPNAQDIARARALGQDPGGDIFIHGARNGWRTAPDEDWTAGCIALPNDEMREVYWMVRVGTPITIRA